MTTVSTEYRFILFTLGLLLIGSACRRGPNEQDPVPLQIEQGVADNEKNIVMDIHQVTVKETILTSKYLYLRVAEGDREYWAATGKSEVRAGESYFYNEALIQTDFESKEMQRVFDTIYLITELVPESHGSSMKPIKKIAEPPAEALESDSKSGFHSSPLAGKATQLTIAELLEDPGAYEDKVVELTGTCTKINEGILGRNWLHLKDGTADSQDLVMTSADAADQGSEITIRALVKLNRDFGAGYSYDVLLEDGVIIR